MTLANGYPLDIANRPVVVCDGDIACGHGRFEGHHAAVTRTRVDVQTSKTSTLEGGVLDLR